jgi:hypothetical protein
MLKVFGVEEPWSISQRYLNFVIDKVDYSILGAEL